MNQKRRAADKDLESLTKKVDEMHVALLGDIENKKDGFITRLRLNEQSLARLWLLVTLLATTVLGACVKLFNV